MLELDQVEVILVITYTNLTNNLSTNSYTQHLLVIFINK